MKKFVIIMCVAVGLTSCVNSATDESTTTVDSTTVNVDTCEMNCNCDTTFVDTSVVDTFRND